MGTELANRVVWYAGATSSLPANFDEAHTFLTTNVTNIFNNRNLVRFRGQTSMPVSVSTSSIVTAARFYVKENVTAAFNVLAPLAVNITMFLKNNTSGATATYTITGSSSTYVSQAVSLLAQNDYTVILTQNGGTTLFIQTTAIDDIYPYINAYTLKTAIVSSSSGSGSSGGSGGSSGGTTTNAADLTGTLPASVLPSSGVTPGQYGTLSNIPIVTVDSKGRVTNVQVTDSVTASLPEPFTVTAGKVGIGTVTPTTILDVHGTVKATALQGTLQGSSITGTIPQAAMPHPVKITSSNLTINNEALSVISSTSTVPALSVVNNGTGNSVQVTKGATTHMAITNSGRMSILHANPTVELDVNGDIKCKNMVSDVVSCGTTLFTCNISVTGTFTTVNTVIKETDQFTVSNVGTATALTVYQMSPGQRNVAEFFAPSGTALKIVNSGFVGIGTPVPGYNLHVIGDVNLTGNIYQSGTLFTNTNATNLTSGTVDSARLATSGATAGTYGSATAIPSITIDDKGRVTRAVTSNVSIPSTAITDLATVGRTGNYSSLSNLPLVWSGTNTYYGASGNLGIGTQTPQTKVDVVGTVRATAFDGSVQASNVTGTLNAATLPAPFTISSGRVGINTATPTRTLQVQGDVNVVGDFYRSNVLFVGSQWTTSGANISYTSGNVGINTATPTRTLQVQGDVNVVGDFYRSNVLFVGSQWTTSGSNISYTSGNVGINTATPNVPLHVTSLGTSGTARTILQLNTLESTTGTTGQLDFSQGGTTTARIANIFEGAGKIGFAFSVWNSALTERMRIANDGNVGIGTVTPQAKLSVQGNVIASGDIGGFGTASDIRLKKEIVAMPSVLETIKQLKPVEYTWKDDIFNEDKRGQRDVGFIAQDVEPLIPLVIRSLDFPNAPEKYQGIAYEKLVPYLVKAVQELSAELEQVRAMAASAAGNTNNVSTV